MVELVDNVLI